MAQGGGRGWFHRKRPQPTPDESPTGTVHSLSNSSTAPADITPPTGSRRMDDPMATARQPSPWSPESRAAFPSEPAQSEAGQGSTPLVAEAATAPAEQSPVPAEVPVVEPGVVAPDPERVQGTRDSSDGESSEPSPITPSRGRIDWDAETAAALSDEVPQNDAHADRRVTAPDRLLEDLIREIVGDATADTASALHPARPLSARDEDPIAKANAQPSSEPPSPSDPAPSLNRAAPSEHTAPASDQTSMMRPVQPAELANIPEDVERPDAHADAIAVAVDAEVKTQNPASGQDSVGSEISLDLERPLTGAANGLHEAGSHEEPDSVNALRVREETQANAAYTPTPDPDVSRETSSHHGGTPLAYELADETRRRIALEEAVLPLPPSTRVLTISNQKGGVGKTTTAVNLAAGLARSGARVLVIDLDPQGNASTALGVDHRSERKSVYEVLVSDLALAEVVQPSTEHELLDCVPATIHLAGAEIELVSLVAREQRLRRALDAHLASMERPYDYVFIDCPPSLGLLTINAFVAAREVLIPIQCEYYALEGLSQLLSNIELIEKHLNPELRLSTILLTMYDSRTNLAQQVAQEVRDHFPTQTLSTIIPRSVRVSEAPSYGQSVISYDYASSGSLSYREAAAEIAHRGAAKPEESN